MEGKTIADDDDLMERVAVKNFVRYDRGDYYEFVPDGDGAICNNGELIWGADHVKEFGRTDSPEYQEFDVPWFTLKFPKKLPANMTFESLKEKVLREAVMEFCAGVKKMYEDEPDNSRARLMEFCAALKKGYGDEPQGLDDNSNSMARTGDAEAHNMDIDPPTKNLDMKELDSALDNCAKGNCAECGGQDLSDELNLVK